MLAEPPTKGNGIWQVHLDHHCEPKFCYIVFLKFKNLNKIVEVCSFHNMS